MPEVYVHLSGGDIERKMLEKAGFVEVTVNKEPSLQPRECPRCKALNTYDALFCAKCSMILVEEVARMVESKTEKAQQSFDYDEVIQKMRADLGLPAQ